MSYKRNEKRSYMPRKLRSTFSTLHHISFRNEWESNLDNAIAQAYKLKEQGYMVEESLQRGALMESQAKSLLKRLKEMDCDAQIIPVATWHGEKVVFLVYKPPKEPAPTREVEKPQAVKRVKPQLPPEELVKKYVKTFFAGTSKEPDYSKLQTDGFIIDPHYVCAFIPKTSNQPSGIVGMLRTLQKGAPLKTFENTAELAKALGYAKRIGNANIAFDDAGTVVISLQNFQKALKVLGRGEFSVHSEGKDKPAFIVDWEGNAIAIAPVIDPEPSLTTTVDGAIKTYESLKA
jgi:hypothetical protein